MAKIKILTALGPDHMAVRKGDGVYSRTAYGPDECLHGAGANPEQTAKLLVGKYGHLPVVGADGAPEPECDESQVPYLGEEPEEMPDGSHAWRVREWLDHTGEDVFS